MGKNTFLFLSVLFCFTSTYLSAQTQTNDDGQDNVKVFTNHVRFQIDAGYGFMTGKTKELKQELVGMGFNNNDVNKYFKDYLFSQQVSSQLHHFINEQYAIGLKYSFFNTKADLEGFLDVGDGVHVMYSENADNLFVSYIGFSFYSGRSLGMNNKWRIDYAVSAGLALYRDEVISNSYSYLITANNIALDESVGIEYFLTKNISIGADISLFVCNIKDIKVNTGSDIYTESYDKDNAENISRLNGSLGLRFYL